MEYWPLVAAAFLGGVVVGCSGFDAYSRDPYLYFSLLRENLYSDIIRQKTHFTNLSPAASCVFNGTTVADGSSITAYQSSSVPAGVQCVSQQRTCTNGVLSGLYTNSSCSVSSPIPNPVPAIPVSQPTVTTAPTPTSVTTPTPTTTSVPDQKASQQIDALLAQVEQLKALLASLQKNGSTNVACPVLTRTLSRGSSGADVPALQNYLIRQSLLASGNNTGFFGSLTEAAVQRWQAQHSIVSTGSPATTGYGAVGPETRAALANCHLI